MEPHVQGANATEVPQLPGSSDLYHYTGSVVAWQASRALIGLGTAFSPRSSMGAGAELKILPITAGRQRKAKEGKGRQNGKR